MVHSIIVSQYHSITVYIIKQIAETLFRGYDETHNPLMLQNWLLVANSRIYAYYYY